MSEQTLTTETTLPSSTPSIAADLKAELDSQMAVSLKDWSAPQPPAQHQNPATPAPETQPALPPDPFSIFKEKFGYETPEAAVSDIEALRAYRAAPPPTPELKFENEQSKTIAEALQAGKLSEVYEVLDQQMRIERLTGGEITADNAADIVKLNMQLKYKDLTAAEIEYKFKKQYGLPPKPGMMPAGYEEEYAAKLAEWEEQTNDKKMELLIDAKLAKPDLLGTKSKLVFPTISRPQDTEYQEWQKTVQEFDREAAETTKAYEAFTPKSLESKLHFADKNNKVDFDFIHEPDPESFKQALGYVTDINEFWKSYMNPDGTPDRKRFLEDIYFMKNRTAILSQAMNQAMNATIKASLPDNSSGGLVRQLPQTQEPNELDKLMRQSLKGYAGF